MTSVSQPCGPILKSYLSFPIKLRIGIISAFATIAVRHHTSPPVSPRSTASCVCFLLNILVNMSQMAAIALCLVLGLEEYWKTPPVETTVDDFNRVKYQPKPSLT